MTNQQQIAVRDGSIEDLEHSFAIAVRQRELLANYIKERLTPGKHFYQVGTSKNSLTKEGAELICLPHGYKPAYVVEGGPDQPPDDDTPYQITVRCSLMKGGIFEGEGMGSASSHVTQRGGQRVPRQPDIGLRHNATLKMAQKSAYIAATLNATAASEFFTQDMEDGGETSPSEYRHPAETRPDTSFFCSEHKETWTKKTRKDGAAWYSHKTDNGWCNMPSVDIAPATPSPAEATAPAPSRPEPGDVPTSGAELLTRAVNELGYKGRAEIFAVLKVASILDVLDLAAAWERLLATKGKP